LLDTITAQTQPLSVTSEDNNDHDDPSAEGLNVGTSRGISRKSTSKKANELSSSLVVRGRHAKKAPPPQLTKSKTQDGEMKTSRSNIFVLLGLAD